MPPQELTFGDWNTDTAQSTNIDIASGGDTFTLAAVIPDSVVSRPDDNDSGSLSQARGLVVNPNSDFSRFAVRLSNNTAGVTRARLFDYSQSTYIETIDISSKTAGDTVTFDTSVDAGTDYGVEFDDSGGSYTLGFYNGGSSYPVSGEDFDIISASVAGSQDTGRAYQNVNDIGNPDNVL